MNSKTENPTDSALRDADNELAMEAKRLQIGLIKRAQHLLDTNLSVSEVLATLGGQVAGQQTIQQDAQQGSQKALQDAANMISMLTGRQQSETSHTEDINAPERISAALARGVDNNELVSQRFNNTAANVADLASVAVGILMNTASAANGQTQAQIPDIAKKNSDCGRKVAYGDEDE